ncbi:hypothetical protein CQR48_0421 [Bifidobacterium thermophilum]|uniref:Uncharacterized protein n=1 Tax=Bifidobacterium thermophilum TaxID=33905 RepID=A0A7X9RMK7_9BIFI|nr:hypothetical protein [Bifidobacterium thermophilum]NME61935.1 hypothetical protein [Bifidobacterium thermophilum]PKU90639.1 hypothetical protein CQR48_0421 [Bifidobacterium thermophilum]
MLYDLTRVSGERVSQVDELKVSRRVWIRQSTFFLALGGFATGSVLSMILVPILGTGSWLPYLPAPIMSALFVFLFSRKRSTAGEKTLRRWDQWRNKRRSLDGEFVLPGDPTPSSPTSYHITIQHSHPVA